MNTLSSRAALLTGRLAVPFALEWPGGRAGPANAPVQIKLREWRQLAALLRGQIGSIGNAYVWGELDIDGRLSDVMTTDMVTALEVDSIKDLLSAMRRKGIRRLPVVTPQGVLIGLLTLDDLLPIMANSCATWPPPSMRNTFMNASCAADRRPVAASAPCGVEQTQSPAGGQAHHDWVPWLLTTRSRS